MSATRAMTVVPPPPRAGLAARWRAAWPMLRKGLIALFFIAVTVLLVQQARGIEWGEVGEVLRDLPLSTLALAAGAALLSHAIYASFDLVGRRWARHELPARQVVPVTFVSYAFNLNLGALVGGFAFRYRLYSRLGLDNDTITRVLAASLVTNWIGYLALAGGLFAFGVVEPPESWPIGAIALKALGGALLATVLMYLGACAWTARDGKPREWSLRGKSFALPSLRLALLQLVLSTLNWMTIAAVLYVLFQQKLPYGEVLGTLLLAAVAGVVAHIPAGLGVLEAVFIAMLGSQLPRGELLAGLVAYRAIYYLLPLAAAVVIYLVLEARASRVARPKQEPQRRLAAPRHASASSVRARE
jgi:glycosyltransferase 2 family protein